MSSVRTRYPAQEKPDQFRSLTGAAASGSLSFRDGFTPISHPPGLSLRRSRYPASEITFPTAASTSTCARIGPGRHGQVWSFSGDDSFEAIRIPGEADLLLRDAELNTNEQERPPRGSRRALRESRGPGREVTRYSRVRTPAARGTSSICRPRRAPAAKYHPRRHASPCVPSSIGPIAGLRCRRDQESSAELRARRAGSR